MANYIMPHEMTAEEVLPMGKTSKYVLPHEVEAEKAALQTPEEKLLSEYSPVERGFIGAGKVASDIKRGVQQTAGKVRNWFPGEESTLPQDIAAEIKSERASRQAISKDTASKIGSGVAQLGLGVGSLAAKPAMAALYGGMLEGPLKGREEPTWGNMVTEGGEGALIGGAGGALGQYLTSGLGKLKNASKGRFANPEEQNRLRIFKENNVPFSLGDITQSNGVLTLEDTIKHIPLSGRKDFLEGQSNRLGEVIKGAPEKIAGVVPGAGKEDINQAIANSIKDKYKQVKDAAGKMYDDVSNRVTAVGNPPIDPSSLRATAIQLKQDYPDAFSSFMDAKAVKRLDDIITGTGPQKSSILGPNGQPITTPASISFEDARWLDKRLGSMIRQARNQVTQGKYDPEAFNQLTGLQKSLRNDITDWSQTIGDPQISKGIAEANKYFREVVVPFRNNPTTRAVVQDSLPPEHMDNLANRMFRLDAPATSTQSIAFMTPEGVQAGRYHLIKQAEAKAMDDALSSGYSPSRFLSQSKLGESGDKLFSSSELGELGDLQELVSSGRRAAGYAFNPPTGASLWGALAGKVPAIPALARVANNVTTSEPIIRSILSDPRLYTGSNKMLEGAENILRKSTIGPSLNTISDQRSPE